MSLSERMRQYGIDCAAMIIADPNSWMGVATWLRNLPKCWAIVEMQHGFDATDDRGEPWLIVDIDGVSVNLEEPCHQFYAYDNESEMNRILGPILRRLNTAWDAASHRFLHQSSNRDRYYDFGMTDALRIILLAALTLNRDFDGAVVGLDIPWEHPADCGASFEGRQAAWAMLPPGRFGELIGVAIDYLRRMTPAGGLEPSNENLQEPTDGLDRESRAVQDVVPASEIKKQADTLAIRKPGMPWREAKKRAEKHVKSHNGAFPSVRQLAKNVGCSRPTIDKAIRNSSYLKARKAEASNSRSVRTVALSDAAIEEASTRQSKELAELVAEQEADKAQEERQTQAAKHRQH